ncbi:D-serine ammonia-lyase [Burkholderia ambifaria]|uniref:D-serine ammonia-lyase n=1 Tax=Burkholderia ambifaria TaxID=152480 RepID=UPI00054EA9BA|nr:D-serine ammonia-lyase [Burkholderia ambifaria]
MNTTRPFEFPGDVLAELKSRRPMLWLNPKIGKPLPSWAPSHAEILAAEMRLKRCGPLLSALFPELAACGGEIDSALMPADTLAHVLGEHHGQWFMKRDDSLPVAGSIKARGGFHEVLALAEHIAEDHGLLRACDDRSTLALPEFRKIFSQYTIVVGSTGNLGLSIGVMAAALGFQCVVHMSADAKQWKKDRLLARGVHVVEHVGDYARAVAAGRDLAASTPRCHFIDDERSVMLFLGYAAAASQLSTQLARAGCVVSAARPLFVYIPCGVGGAPGGIAHGLKAIFGPDVHCFFAEPTASPCMLVQLASGSDQAVSVYDIGLDNQTDADGLAVGRASDLVAPLMRGQVSGIFTVTDEQLYASLLAAKNALNIELEPSAAAAIGGPAWLSRSAAGREYARCHDISTEGAIHVIWTTGGSLVPAHEHARYQRRALGMAV